MCSFCVRLGRVLSEWRLTVSGVRQESCVGRLLCLLYATDLRGAMVIEIPHAAFADDCQIYADISDGHGYSALQASLCNIEEWARRWKFKLSPAKSAVLHIHDNERHVCIPHLRGHHSSADLCP